MLRRILGRELRAVLHHATPSWSYVKKVKEADLKIEGIDSFQKTLTDFMHQLGLVRCPAAMLDCLAASVANLFGLKKVLE